MCVVPQLVPKKRRRRDRRVLFGGRGNVRKAQIEKKNMRVTTSARAGKRWWRGARRQQIRDLAFSDYEDYALMLERALLGQNCEIKSPEARHYTAASSSSHPHTAARTATKMIRSKGPFVSCGGSVVVQVVLSSLNRWVCARAQISG